MDRDQDRLGLAQDLITFIDASPTPYHAVEEVTRRLREHGFCRVEEGDAWTLPPGTKAYVLRDSAVIAFVLGGEPPWQAGFTLVGAHTDSPNFRLKPLPEFDSSGFLQLAIEVYGGVLLSTWLDRDLALGGRLALADGTTRLVQLAEAFCRIPNVAIHLNRDVNKDGLVLNPQQHLAPVFGLRGENVPSILERLIAKTASADFTPEEVLGFDLCLFDRAGGAFGGAEGEFLFSGRLDNLASCHAAVTALLAAARQDASKTRVIALYDHEEVGSQSAIGARSLLLESVLERIIESYPEARRDAKARALARSLFVSCDMAHGVHPNYADKHDKQHRPVLGGGPVLKSNVNQSYATEAVGGAAFVAACRAAQVQHQNFSVRNDIPCGSTIGPISAARLGIRTVDIGNPMLSMHSCREMAATSDVEPMIRVLSQLLSS